MPGTNLETLVKKELFWLPPAQQEQMAAFARLFAEAAATMNLSAIREPSLIARLHFADSLAALETALIKPGLHFGDVGTGAGFPGVPLAIACPDCFFTLIDSVGKKLRFIEKAAEKLGLLNIKTVHARAEDLGHSAMRASLNGVVSRATAPLPVLAEYTLPLLKKGGVLVAYKGPAAQEEVHAAKKGVALLGGGPPKLFTPPARQVEGHVLVLVEKTGPTPALFPRPPKEIKSKPL